jgi:hydroxypyruvate isomerase
MGYVSGGDLGARTALNRLEDHDEIERMFRSGIARAAKAGVVNVITFSGWRKGITDEDGLRNTIVGLNRVKKIAENSGINLCLELLNSKVDHLGYMADHTGGVPGRHELNDSQEVNWVAVMKAIAATSYGGYVAHEFRPTGDPLESLRQAVDLCDV